MSKLKDIIAPKRKEIIVIRLMVLLGILSITIFFIGFWTQALIDNLFLFGLLIAAILFDAFRIIYIWYHYWSISIPEKPKTKPNLSVDILTTFFPGEPYEMITETLLAIQKIKNPHTTYLCDEANDGFLKNFCKENNIIHVIRDNRKDAKAGNINNALLQAKGDICLIIDPDHVPKEYILDELIPYFEDEDIGFVQSVQAYYNVEESLVARGAAEQTYHFYGPVMMSMNSYGTVNAIGANCMFRRKAIDSIGGHAAGLSEDMHTAMQLHAKGWKSVYVPKVLTKGLSPATLTSYYKQQLKWSRGTLELLVSVYPKLFTKFSLRQKIHYGILPLHYLSGIVYLISFLIPIISLFSANTPWKGNIINFSLLYIPILISILGIRFYVQRWVMIKSERGIHLVGGLLQNGTWWIFILGLVYTVFRKKVPYLPTPKEDKERTSWKILIPNLVVGSVSLISIIYGLSIDYTPFSILMSGFAFLNAVFMFYTLVFAFQKPKVVKLNSQNFHNSSSIFKKIQNFCFQSWRKVALPVVIIVLASALLIQFNIKNSKWEKVPPIVQNKNIITYFGIFDPGNENGLSNLQNVDNKSEHARVHFDIISIYSAWNKNDKSDFPQSLIDSIYNQKSIPMITWEPWLNSFANEIDANKHVYDLIEEGYFDDYIFTFSDLLKNLQKPVFLRFAHEFDNPFYPWYVNEKVDAIRFKKAWIHVYELFKFNNVNNVIWIWNPWKAENVASFYPGKEYVDWIGVNILNYGMFNPDTTEHEFSELYQPFHEEFQYLTATPVIISEFGSLKQNQNQNEWIHSAFTSIENEFAEIKSVVYFNSKFDKNFPFGVQRDKFLDWTLAENQVLNNSFTKTDVPGYVLSQLPILDINAFGLNNSVEKSEELKNIKGLNLKKGHDWRKDYHVLSRKNLISDFERIKDLGINSLKFEGNSVYDDNVVKISGEFNLNLSYGFWIPSELDFVNDTVNTKKLKKSILKKIELNRKHKNIKSWSIQNDVQYNQRNFYHKPELLYQNSAYILWLKDLAKCIKEIDSKRSLIIDIEINSQSIYFARVLLSNIKEIDALGLVVKEDKYLNSLISFLKDARISFIFSEIEVPALTQNTEIDINESFFVTAWQDQHQNNKLTFDGITDIKGRYKIDYFYLQNAIKNTKSNIESPKFRILRPAYPLYSYKKYDYYALFYNEIEGWRNAGELTDLHFEWSLVKCDIYGNYLAIKDVGIGPILTLQIPPDYNFYKLLLTVLKDEVIITTSITSLNTPLEQGKEKIMKSSTN